MKQHRVFNKTEAEILQEWLEYYNYFDGGLTKYNEITTGTANRIFELNDPLLPDEVKSSAKQFSGNGYNFLINIVEWFDGQDYTQAQKFRDNMTKQFRLKAEGYNSILVEANLANYTGTLTNGDGLHAYHFVINPAEQQKVIKGVEYNIEPINNHPVYKWVIPSDIKFTYE